MKRLLHRLFAAVAAISLLLCITTVGVWIRSYWKGDNFSIIHAKFLFIETNWGCFVISTETEYPAKITLLPTKGLGNIVHTGPAIPFSNHWEFRHSTEMANPVFVQHSTFGFGHAHTVSYLMEDNGIPASQAGEGNRWSIPAWFIVILTGSIPLQWSLLARRRRLARNRRSKGHCRHCGYDLRATPDRCPECGVIPDHVS